MRWISSAGKLACDKQAGDDQAGYELRLSHARDLSETSPARSIRKSHANGGIASAGALLAFDLLEKN
jgi:hypothetical protein